MSPENSKQGDDGPAVNGTPVDVGSHNPDPNANNWLHPEQDRGIWERAFEAVERAAPGAAAAGAAAGDKGSGQKEKPAPSQQEAGPKEGAPAQEKAAAQQPTPAQEQGPGKPVPAPPDPAEPPASALPEPPRRPTPTVPDTEQSIRDRQRIIIGAIIVAVLVLTGVGIWLLVNTLRSDTGAGPAATDPAPLGSPQTTAPLPREVDAFDYQLGDCFADFNSEATKATAVVCDSAHSAQLVGIHRYGDTEAYPGREAFKDKAQEACQNAKLNDRTDEYTLNFQFIYPSNTSWDKGDRRVDCFVVASNGNTIMHDLLQR